MLDNSITLRGQSLTEKEKKKIKKALTDLHNLEIMATNVYRCEISDRTPEIKRELIAAMKNEMGHNGHYLVKLYEYQMKPVWYRWIFWIVGWIIGTFSSLRGRKGIFQANIWTESKAVRHYEELLKNTPWDQDTRQVIDQDRLDEVRHLELWTRLLKELDQASE